MNCQQHKTKDKLLVSVQMEDMNTLHNIILCVCSLKQAYKMYSMSTDNAISSYLAPFWHNPRVRREMNEEQMTTTRRGSVLFTLVHNMSFIDQCVNSASKIKETTSQQFCFLNLFLNVPCQCLLTLMGGHYTCIEKYLNTCAMYCNRHHLV